MQTTGNSEMTAKTKSGQQVCLYKGANDTYQDAGVVTRHYKVIRTLVNRSALRIAGKHPNKIAGVITHGNATCCFKRMDFI